MQLLEGDTVMKQRSKLMCQSFCAVLFLIRSLKEYIAKPIALVDRAALVLSLKKKRDL